MGKIAVDFCKKSSTKMLWFFGFGPVFGSGRGRIFGLVFGKAGVGFGHGRGFLKKVLRPVNPRLQSRNERFHSFGFFLIRRI
ncbi:MAG: hypothetical protein AB1813_16400 [Verrucomicrobiota bacterium]